MKKKLSLNLVIHCSFQYLHVPRSCSVVPLDAPPASTVGSGVVAFEPFGVLAFELLGVPAFDPFAEPFTEPLGVPVLDPLSDILKCQFITYKTR